MTIPNSGPEDLGLNELKPLLDRLDKRHPGVLIHEFKMHIDRAGLQNISPIVITAPILIVGFDPLTLTLYYRLLDKGASVEQNKPV